MKREEKTAKDRVLLARNQARPTAMEYIRAIFSDFLPFSGDRVYGDDESVLGGIASFHGLPVTVIAHQKGRDLEENMRYRFGMPNPDGYRKAERLMKQAEKFGRPVITFVDTPGAYPGKEAEERGQGEAIARCIQTMSRLKVPEIAIFIGEGGSGGALAFATADRVLMLENSIYAILSPEGLASILWHDSSRWGEAAEVMKLTAPDLEELGICDRVIPELSFAEDNQEATDNAKKYIFDAVDTALVEELNPLLRKSFERLQRERYKRLRDIGK